jgi:nucleotide-binding universal stress UspA family protein
MYPFRRILVPTDFSTASEWVFDDVVRIAAASNAEILVLHIRMTWEKAPDALRLPADPSVYEYVEKQELERLRNRIRHANADVRTRLVVKQGPHPGEEICRTAADENVDLVAIATHARHHVAHLLIGSTTLSVIKDPPAPVLAIRYGIQRRPALSRILVPVHLKQTSLASLDLAVAMARRQRCEVRVLTVCGEKDTDAAAKLHEHLAARVADIPVHRNVIRGDDVVREITRFAEKHDIDMIFLNAQGQLGDSKTAIVRSATVPVMIVPK